MTKPLLRKGCKDCEPGSKRAAPHPGPRCATHHRAFLKAQKDRARDAHRLRTYGITADEYAALHAFQGGVCAICQRATGKTRALAVDHDHETGDVRGLLCKRCNYDLLGSYDTAALARAIDYLAFPPFGRMRNPL